DPPGGGGGRGSDPDPGGDHDRVLPGEAAAHRVDPGGEWGRERGRLGQARVQGRGLLWHGAEDGQGSGRGRHCGRVSAAHPARFVTLVASVSEATRTGRGQEAVMGRIRDAVTTGARAVRRIPIPSALTHQALREARSPQPPTHVLKAHAIEQEMLGRTRTIWLDEHRADQGIVVFLHGGAYVSGPFTSDWSWLSRQVERLGCAGLMIDYRNAPDHQHPVARDDVEAALHALAEQGRLEGRRWAL